MTDVENSDDERYANESFENESDVDVPEMSEFESETSDNSDDDDGEDDELPSVKINTVSSWLFKESEIGNWDSSRRQIVRSHQEENLVDSHVDSIAFQNAPLDICVKCVRKYLKKKNTKIKPFC